MTVKTKLRRVVHAIVSPDEDGYVAACIEIAAVTQGSTLAETIRNLEEAATLYFEGENLPELGFSRRPRLRIRFDIPLNL